MRADAVRVDAGGTRMIVQDSQRGLGFLPTAAARKLRRLVDRRLQPLGLTRAQWAVLTMQSHRGGLNQSQLAAALEIEKSTGGRLIDHLEKSQWVERRAVPADRRCWGVHVTPRALPLISEVQQIVLDIRTCMRIGLSAEQQRQLSRTLQAVKSNLL